MLSQFGGQIVINSGTPQQINTNDPAAGPVMATRISIQPAPAASGGLVYVFFNVPVGTTTPSTATFPYFTLAAGTSTAPGDDVADAVDYGDGSEFDTSKIWVDGAHTGDVVNYLFKLKI